MVWKTVSIDLDVDDLLNELGTVDKTQLVADLLNDGYVPRGWGRVDVTDLSDPTDRLRVITALRAEGYTVEPA